MSNLAAISSFDSVYQIEQTDVARGGVGNLANAQAQSLLNRTQWLKDAMRGYIGVTALTGTHTLTLTDILQNLVAINAVSATNAIITLPALNNTTDVGTRVSLMAYNVSTQVSVTSAGSNDIIFGASARQSLYMGDADTIELIWTGTAWLLTAYNGNFVEVSQPEYAYYILPNTVVAYGQLLNRIDYPRLWECVNANMPGSVVSDVTWTTLPGNKGFFSSGNGSTTFRVPDLRSMFLRGLDLGAGIDFGRPSNNPGDYEADVLAAHNHSIRTSSSPLSTNDNADPARSSSGGSINTAGGLGAGKTISTEGGTETRPKNIGLLPLIKV